MGKIIAVASQKGGVGKTITALNLGHCMSRFGSKVMLIDGDPQGALGIASNLSNQTELGLVNLLKNTAKPEDIVFTTKEKSMSIVWLGSVQPADVLLLEDEARNGTFGMLIRSLTEGYDYVIIDSPSGVGGIPASLLSISDGVILTINCRVISLKTIPLFLKLIKSIKDQHNPKLALEGVLITMFDSRNDMEKQILEQIKKSLPGDAFFKTMIPYDEYYEKASFHSVPIAMMPKGVQAARPYFELALELKEKELLVEKEEVGDEDIVGLF
jgi:chromosome partitioning protein